MIPILWLCGPPGVGKSSISWKIYERLQRAGGNPAYVDADQLGMCSPPPPDDQHQHRLKERNVASLRSNFGAAGADALIVSGMVDAERGLDLTELGGPDVLLIQLRVDLDELRTRLSGRRGSAQESDAAVTEAQALDRSTVTAHSIDTTGLSIDETATRIQDEIAEWAPANMPTASEPDRGGAKHQGGEVLWLFGANGVGKSTVGFQAYLDLARSGRPVSYLDVVQLGFGGSAPGDPALRAQNLAAVWHNFQDVGSKVAVVVGPVATRSEAGVYEQAIPQARFTWCRLQVSDEELTRRILSRGEGGSWVQPGDPLRGLPRRQLLAVAQRAIADDRILNRNNFARSIELDGLEVGEAARTILRITDWPGSAMT